MVGYLNEKRPDAPTSDRLRGTPTHNGAVVGVQAEPHTIDTKLTWFCL